MKNELAIFLGLLSFATGIIVGLIREARQIEKRKAYLRRIHNDFPDSIGQ